MNDMRDPISWLIMGTIVAVLIAVMLVYVFVLN
jgi:hypothetical protein